MEIFQIFKSGSMLIFQSFKLNVGVKILPFLATFPKIGLNIIKWGSVPHQMAVPDPSISCCVLNHNNIFYQIQDALALNWDTCCHLVLCLQLLPFHFLVTLAVSCCWLCPQVAATMFPRVFPLRRRRPLPRRCSRLRRNSRSQFHQHFMPIKYSRSKIS